MGFITGLVTLPLAPVRGTMWIAERLLDEAERELEDPELLEWELDEAEAAWERGELTDEEFAEIEEDLVARMTGQEGWYG
jgi:Gas vesicle protein G